MKINDEQLKKLLVETGKISVGNIQKLEQQAKTEKKSLQEVVVRANVIPENDLTKLLAQRIDVPFVDLRSADFNRDVLQLIPERMAKQYKAVAFALDKDGVVYVAMEDPDDIQAVNILQKQLAKPIRIHLATVSSIQTALEQYGGGNVSNELAKVIAIEDKEAAEEAEVSEEDISEDSPVAQTINLIIDYGIKSRASDIHIEPREDIILIRYRVDGVLQEANKLPHKILPALVSRIKILANLKIDEHRAPQDGRFKISADNHVYALRVSTLPVIDGEKVVIRILDESTTAATFDSLGFWGRSVEQIKEAIALSDGMILVTGPTGSGKSTTLFSMLSSLNNPTINISTIEDPVEYRIIGVNQTQVNPVAGMTFANGLRSLLRQDPNIIMVGEIRDGETADLAVQAALTGHLVLSTLHTNNAATCIPRLLDMKVEPFLIASTVRVVIGQRLVRKLCTVCRETYAPDEALIERIKQTFSLKTAEDLNKIHLLEQSAAQSGLGDDKTKDQPKETSELSTSSETIKRLWKIHEGGCDKCNHTGYKGRLGIYEVLENNRSIDKLIISSSTSEDLQAQAIADGMVTLQIDGFIKALRGLTSLEEILRVTSSED